MNEQVPASLRAELEKDDLDYEVIKDEIVTWYNKATRQQFPAYVQLSAEQKDTVVSWLLKNYENICTHLFAKELSLRSLFHLTLSDKISQIAQYHCPICTDTYPISIIPIRIPPHSYQNRDPEIKKAFKRALRHRFSERPIGSHYFDKKICLHVVFVLADGREDKDVDNMAKLLLDGLKDVIFSYDKNIGHLSVVKIRQQDAEEFVYINLRESKLSTTEDVFSERLHHSWAGAEMLNLDDFIS